MKVKIIRNEDEYNVACDRLYELLQIENGSANEEVSNEIELLALLIEDYENKHYPIPLPDPIEAILFRIEQMGISDKEFSELVGGRQRKSELLRRKRKLSLSLIRKLHDKLKIPAEVLIKNYKLL